MQNKFNIGKSPPTLIKKQEVKKSKIRYIPLKNNVYLITEEDDEEDLDLITTLEDVILLQKRKPQLILGFKPNLYSEFFDKKTGIIKQYVFKGNIVVVKDKFKSRAVDNIPRIVKDVYLKSLHNMTVIIAELDDGDFQLSNRLLNK